MAKGCGKGKMKGAKKGGKAKGKGMKAPAINPKGGTAKALPTGEFKAG